MSSGARRASLHRPGHDASQFFGIARREGYADGYIPMMRPRYITAFYGIFLGHEHRKVVRKGYIINS
jgi:hypothetical protein